MNGRETVTNGLFADLKRRLLSGEAMLYIAFIALIILFSVASPVFLTVSNFENIGRQTALVSIIAVGMTLVIIAGEFDLSVGSVLALSGVVSALAMKYGDQNWLAGALAALGTGAFVGWVNGALTTHFRIPSFLITLGSLGIARGLAMLLTNTRPVIVTSETYYAISGKATCSASRSSSSGR